MVLLHFPDEGLSIKEFTGLVLVEIGTIIVQQKPRKYM
jgi:hypothetical protein